MEVIDADGTVIRPRQAGGLVVTPHPLTLEGRRVLQGATVLPGETLAAFLRRYGVDLGQPGWVVCVGGAAVPELMWGHTRPAPGHLIECRRTVGKTALRLVAFAVLAYYTFGAGATGAGGWAAAGQTAATTLGAGGLFAAQLGAYMLGSMLINKMLPPTRARMGDVYANNTGSTYAISGGRNRARPYEPLGLLFGQVRVVPDLASTPYTWFEGEDQYAFVRLHGGINVGAITGFQLGDTDLSTFDGAIVVTSGLPGSSTDLVDWSNVDTLAGADVPAPTAPGAWVVRTSSVGSVHLAVDLSAQLYDMSDNGSMATATVTLDVQKRLLPSGSWEDFITGQPSITLQSTSTKPLRKTLLTELLTAGQYEVRMRKTVADVATTRAANAVAWVSLKSYQPDSADYTSYPQVGVRIRASGQLSGSLDEVNWLATSAATEVWNGTTWVTEASTNPGAHFLQFARGIYDSDGRLQAGMGLPDDQIDIDGLAAFMVHCAAQGYRFDHWFDGALSCQDMLEAFAAAGLGSMSYHTGRLGVVWATASDPLEGVVAMGNIKAGTFKVAYATRDTAEELEVTCLDRDNNWRPLSVRVKAPGVTTPRDTARYAPVGATTEDSIVLTARFGMAQNIWQRKSVSWDMDLEHMTFRRYSVIALSHDLTQWGYSGRLAGAVNVSGTVTVTLDEPVPWNDTATVRKLGLRLPGEQGYRLFDVATFSGETRTLTLSGSWPGGVAVPGATAGNPAHDTLYIWDFAATPGKRLRIVEIEPTANLGGARITAVPEDPDFWTFVASGTYVVPPVAPSVAALAVSGVVVTQERLALTYDAGAELTVTFEVEGNFDHAQVWGAASGDALKFLGETRTRRFSGWRVESAGAVDVEVRPFTQLGRPGAVGTASYTVALDDTLGGNNGISVFTGTIFKQVGSPPSAPTGGTFNFTSSVLTPPSGWTGTQPTATATPTYACQFTFTSTTPGSTVTAGTWTTPGIAAVIAASGTDGMSVFVLTLYKQAGSAPSAPTGGEYTFTGDVLTSIPSGWSRTRPASSTTPTYETTQRVQTSTPGTPVTLGAWTTPVNVGQDGAAGAAAKTVVLTGTHQVFVVDKAGAGTPSTITLTATPQNLSGSPSWATSPAVTLGGASNATVRTLAYADMGANDSVEVTVTWDGQSDKLRPAKVREGADGITPVAPNLNHSLPADNAGNVSSYLGSGTTLQVYEGSTLLTFRTSLAASSFTIGAPVVVPTGAITPGGFTGATTTTATGAVHSAASAAADVITITWPVTVRRANGADVVTSITQTLTKSKAGTTGTAGTSVYTATVYRQIGSAPGAPTGGSFNFTTGVLTPPASWTVAQPATSTTPTYACEFTFSTGTPGATVTAGTWTTPYVDAVAGAPGSAGESVHVVEVYLQNASLPATPSGGSYTFSTDTFVAPAGGWSRTQPTSTTTPTWRATYRFATSTPAVAVNAGTYAAPVVCAQSGTNGTSGTSVYTATVYRQIGSAPGAPTGGSFNFTTGVLTPPASWTVAQPATSTTPTYACEFTFSTGTPGATVTAGTWTTPYVDAVAGAPGSAGESVHVVEVYLQNASLPATPSGGSYTFSTDTFVAPAGGWSRTQPTSTTTPTWRATYRFATSTPAVAVNAGTYAAPVVCAQSGTNGTSGTSVYTATVYRQIGSAPGAPTGGSFNFTTGVLTPPASWSVTQPATSTTPTYACEFTFSTGTPGATVTAGTWTAPYVDAVAGAPGVAATAYWLARSVGAVQKSLAGVYTPAVVPFSAVSGTGAGLPAPYAGRFVIATSPDGSSYTNQYTSGADEPSKNYTVPSGIATIRCRLYLAGGTTTLVDEEVVPVVSDGATGSTARPF